MFFSNSAFYNVLMKMNEIKLCYNYYKKETCFIFNKVSKKLVKRKKVVFSLKKLTLKTS